LDCSTDTWGNSGCRCYRPHTCLFTHACCCLRPDIRHVNGHALIAQTSTLTGLVTERSGHAKNDEGEPHGRALDLPLRAFAAGKKRDLRCCAAPSASSGPRGLSRGGPGKQEPPSGVPCVEKRGRRGGGLPSCHPPPYSCRWPPSWMYSQGLIVLT
jgi:hypothetical protein